MEIIELKRKNKIKLINRINERKIKVLHWKIELIS